MIKIIGESSVTPPEEETMRLMKDFVSFLKRKDIDVVGYYYSNKAIYVSNEEDAQKALHYLKTEFRDARKNGINIILNTDIEGIDRIIPIRPMFGESLNEALTLTTIKRIDPNVIHDNEYIIRDLLKMKPIVNLNDEHIYIAKNGARQTIFASVSEDGSTFYVFDKLDADAIDDMVTILNENGTDATWENWVDDYNGQTLTFWEYIKEWQ